MDEWPGHVDLGESRSKDYLISEDHSLVPSAQKPRLGPGPGRTRLPRRPLSASVSPPQLILPCHSLGLSGAGHTAQSTVPKPPGTRAGKNVLSGPARQGLLARWRGC